MQILHGALTCVVKQQSKEKEKQYILQIKKRQ